MAGHDTEPTAEASGYFPETKAMVEALRENPTQLVHCIHGDGPAVGVYEVPKGCIAFPGVQTQALCPQHVLTDGSFEGMYPIIDLSIGGGWSITRNQTPDYCMVSDGETGVISLTKFHEVEFS